MIGKLKQKKIIDVKTGKVTLSWVGHEKSKVSQDSEQLANSVSDSEITEPIMESQNELPLSRINPELSENQSPEPSPDKGYKSPQTIQNIQTIQTATEEEKKAISENSSKKISKNILARNFLSSVASHSRMRDREVAACADRALEEKNETPQSMSSLSNVLTAKGGQPQALDFKSIVEFMKSFEN